MNTEKIETALLSARSLLRNEVDHIEYDELYPSYGHHWLQRAEAVIKPVGESLPNTEIFRRLESGGLHHQDLRRVNE